MTTEIQTKEPNAPRARIRVKYNSAKDHLTLVASGLGEQPAQRLRCTAGQEITLTGEDGIYFETDCLQIPKGYKNFLVYPYTNHGLYILNSNGQRLDYIDLASHRVDNIDTDAPLWGIGAYTAPYETIKGKRGIRYWAEEHAKRGLTAMRVILLSGTRFGYDTPWGSTIEHDIDCSLSFDFAFHWAMRSDLAYAASLGVRVVLDIFDMAGMKRFGGRWARHPFNYRNNQASEIREGLPLDGGPFDDKYDSISKWERLWQGHGYYLDRETQADYAYQASMLAWDNHLTCLGNEIRSRTVEHEIYSKISSMGPAVMISGTYLWTGTREEREAEAGLFRTDLISEAHYIRLQRIDSIQPTFPYDCIKGGLRPYHRVILDTDGTGSGNVRGKNDRPTISDIRNITHKTKRAIAADTHIHGFFAKTLSNADALRCMDTIAEELDEDGYCR